MIGEINIPNPDRRAHRRILTLKNARFAVLGLVVVVVGLLLFERRRGNGAGDYGRLFGKQISQPQIQTPAPPDIITEAPVPENRPDRYIDAEARDRTFGINQPPPVAPQQASNVSATAAPAGPVPAQAGGNVAVSGDEKGVSVVRTPNIIPKLTGGFGRPQGVPPATASDATTTREDH